MDITLAIIAVVLSILGIVGAILPAIPSAVFSYCALLCAYFCSYTDISISAIIIWGIVSILVSLFDYFLPIYFTKRFGGSKQGVYGTTIGMIAGFFIFPPIGFILCPPIGAIIGELIADRSNVERAVKVGFGSLVAFFFGSGSKLLISLFILLIILKRLWPVVWSSILALF